jgi:hypothetical protein
MRMCEKERSYPYTCQVMQQHVFGNPVSIQHTLHFAGLNFSIQKEVDSAAFCISLHPHADFIPEKHY